MCVCVYEEGREGGKQGRYIVRSLVFKVIPVPIAWVSINVESIYFTEELFLFQAYQHLFYLLQTHPIYFAKLIFEMPQSRTNRFLENVVLTVFNYAQNNREQYLLIKLFDTALQEEIE